MKTYVFIHLYVRIQLHVLMYSYTNLYVIISMRLCSTRHSNAQTNLLDSRQFVKLPASQSAPSSQLVPVIPTDCLVSMEHESVRLLVRRLSLKYSVDNVEWMMTLLSPLQPVHRCVCVEQTATIRTAGNYYKKYQKIITHKLTLNTNLTTNT